LLSKKVLELEALAEQIAHAPFGEQVAHAPFGEQVAHAPFGGQVVHAPFGDRLTKFQTALAHASLRSTLFRT
jgi:hypothetical protein